MVAERSEDIDVVGIADDGDLAVLAGELNDEVVLDRVGVLILVDHHMPEPAPGVGEDVGMLSKEVDGVEQQIVEIHGPGLLDPTLILDVDVGRLLLRRHGRGLDELFRAEPVVLGRADHVVHRTRLEPFRVDVEIAHHVGDQALGVSLVVDGETGGVSQRLAVAPQNAHTSRVKGAHPHLLGDRPDQTLCAILHLGRGFVGEGDGEEFEG